MNKTGTLARLNANQSWKASFLLFQPTIPGYGFTKNALQMALEQRKPQEGAIFHTDQGIEYAAVRFQEALVEAQLKASMSRKGNCLDNATTESFFHTFKTESYYQRIV
jgi:transposase InsO family protein